MPVVVKQFIISICDNSTSCASNARLPIRFIDILLQCIILEEIYVHTHGYIEWFSTLTNFNKMQWVENTVRAEKDLIISKTDRIRRREVEYIFWKFLDKFRSDKYRVRLSSSRVRWTITKLHLEKRAENTTTWIDCHTHKNVLTHKFSKVRILTYYIHWSVHTKYKCYTHTHTQTRKRG